MLRISCLTLCVLSIATGVHSQPAVAETVPVAANPPGVLLPAKSNWEHTEILRTSVGWRDNVMLSPFVPISRAFGRAEVETFILWTRNDWQFVSFVNGDVLRYLSPPAETAGEQQWFGHTELRWQRRPAWRLALKADAFLQDMVVDLSETETVRTLAPTRVYGAFATVATRVALPGGFALEPIGQVKRTDYRSFAGDYDETRLGVRLEWRRQTFGLAVTGFEHQRDYADRQQSTAGGRTLSGTRLQFWQRVVDAKVTKEWAARGAWSAALTAGRLENRDRSSGFFDYDQEQAGAELNWQGVKWKVAVEAEAKRLDYLLQTVGAGTNPPARMAETFETSVQCDRELSPVWSVFLQHRWERSRSNETGFSYRANTVLAGAQRNF